MKLPFPTIQDTLAYRPHMYVCLESGDKKKFLSCQTKKPSNITEENPPFEYVEEKNDINRNPFKWPTLIACDYAFGLDYVHIDRKLLTKNRRDICQDLYNDIWQTIQHSSFRVEEMDVNNLITLNPYLTRKIIKQAN